MKMTWVLAVLAVVTAGGSAMQAQDVPYKVLQTAKVGGEGGFDYVYADAAARRLYVPRLGPEGKVTVWDMDTLKPAGEVDGASGHGVAFGDGHGFLTSKPVTMFDAKTLKVVKTIEVQGGPDGIFGDKGRVYVFSHSAPNVTVIDAKDGAGRGRSTWAGLRSRR